MRETLMKQSYLSRLALLLGIALASCGFAVAQDNSANKTQSTEKKNPSAKAKKTWTDDDVSALHSPADSYKDQRQTQVQSAGDAARNSAEAQDTPATKEPPRNKPPLLSDPKTVESADKMIAWEDRDIAAQEEFVIRLKTQLESAPLEDRDHLQKLIIEHQKIIADTRSERDGLVAQKKVLAKKSAAASDSANAAQPPQ